MRRHLFGLGYQGGLRRFLRNPAAAVRGEIAARREARAIFHGRFPTYKGTYAGESRRRAERRRRTAARRQRRYGSPYGG